MLVWDKNKYTLYISEKKDGTAREIPSFIYTKQVHGNSIHILDQNTNFIDSENDGIVSKLLKKKIGVLLADCNGIVMMGSEWYGVIHAGRKGLKNGIIENAIHILKEHNENITELKIYIGPSIRVCCYEVGEEFLGYFDQKYITKRESKLYLDMIAVIKDIVINAGILVENIEINEFCTHCSGKFFSYRNNNNNQRLVVAVEKKQ